MPEINNESTIAYKIFEKMLNRKIKSYFNCHRIVVLVDKLLRYHIKRVRIYRFIVKKWLDSKGYSNKEQIADVAKKYISIEAKLDDFDDSLYSITQNWNKKKQSLASMIDNLNELRMILRVEQDENKKNKISLLKDEIKK
ncbi:hypothetical protein [Bacillus sp. AFS031507]|uniref:hypothetical protein n=1 Tax=Bacillus sp. AFS031507 TaxID=2033496 RepID=UPI000BFDA564|nr:hypothetical protein [Bacillus sp. AFS031507]PGY12995.1 hypothetical protein COE25_07405 [Bacillus sp. AFS031507]